MDIFEIRKANLIKLIGSRRKGACAEKWEMAPAHLSQVLSNKTAKNLGEDVARRIEQKEGLPHGWLDALQVNAVAKRAGTYGSAAAQPAIEANAEIIGGMSGWDSTTPLGDDEVAIPLYKEVELAAGNGATEVIEVPGRLLRFAKSTLREAGVLECNAVCATIKGRSMERLIMDGATIGIDTGTTRIEDGEIYAFDQGGMLRVKYLYRLPGGGVRIRSENDEEFPDETLTAEEFANVRMLGWVFWWSTVRRRRGLSIAK